MTSANAADLLPAFREALALHEGLRRLGFAAEDIYVCQRLRDCMLQVVLRTQGKAITLDAAVAEMPESEFARRWEEAAAAWNQMPEAEARALYDASRIGCDAQCGLALLSALVTAGIEPPRLNLSPATLEALRLGAPMGRRGQA